MARRVIGKKEMDRAREQRWIIESLLAEWYSRPEERLGRLILNLSRDSYGSVNEGLTWNRADEDWLSILEER